MAQSNIKNIYNSSLLNIFFFDVKCIIYLVDWGIV
jgi:hypothetical protein